MPRRPDRAWLLLLLAPLLVGCQPDIGDECSTALDCSTIGDRLCDTSQPDGYCTIFNCEPDTCPDEAACVAFQLDLDPACGPLDDGRYSRFSRSFCMYVCDDDDDCRSGYECIRPVDRRNWGASVVDKDTDTDDPQDTRVCLVKPEAGWTPPGTGDPPGTCTPGQAGTLPPPYQPATGGTGGIGGGAAGSGGGGGSSAGGAT
ncbi:MAG: hypothetical protein JRI23_33250, partial [Deltaproteobacteria bacterium]|nr:hypothetical protein [Deltaproteobacteria bacterium]MBW2537145.1 hypothetical protein [Deltaproteobacteria bacterium]